MNTSYKKPAIAILFATALLVLAATLAGCAKQPPRPSGLSMGNSLGRIRAGAESAQFNVREAKTLAGPLAGPALKSADHSLEVVITRDVPDAVNEASDAEIARIEADYSAKKWEQTYKDEIGRWPSYRQRKQLAWIIGITLGVWLIGGIAGLVTGLAGNAGVSSFIIRLIPFGNIWAILRDRIGNTKRITTRKKS